MYTIIVQREHGQSPGREKGEKMQGMTDLQFITILEMVDMILDGCQSIEEAKEKVERLIEQRKDKKEKAE